MDVCSNKIKLCSSLKNMSAKKLWFKLLLRNMKEDKSAKSRVYSLPITYFYNKF